MSEYKKFSEEVKKFEQKWLEGVIKQFPRDVYSDGMVLDEMIDLIDEGKCNA